MLHRPAIILTLLLPSFWCGPQGAIAQADCLPGGSLQPLDTWQTVQGGYDAGGWTIYQVSFDLGVRYIFKTGCGNGATADHDTHLEFMTPVCTVIQQNDNACELGRSMLDFNSFFGDGMVLWIRVRGAQGQAGTFTMAYRSVGGVPGACNECPSYDATLAPSSLWQAVEGTYDNGACAVYRMLCQAGTSYTFKTGCGDGATADHDTRIEVNGQACAPLVADDDGCESGRSMVTWTALTNGYHYVKVSGSGGSGGTFTMAYQQAGGNGSLCGACTTHDFPLGPGFGWSTHSSSYLSAGCRIYRIASPAVGYQYTFKTGCGDGAAADHDTRLELYNASCELLAVNEGGCGNGGSLLHYTVTTPGSLYLRVLGSGGAFGFYTLAARRGGTCTACPDFDQELDPTAAWQNGTGSYFANGCWLYKVNVQAGHTYVFQTEGGYGAASDHAHQLQLLTDQCEPMPPGPWPWWTGGNRLYHHATSTGPVFLKVQGWGTAAGTHTLAYRDVGTAMDDCAEQVPIPLGHGAVRLSGSLQGATPDTGLDPGSPLFGLPVKWYVFDIEEPCYTVMVSYCGLDPVWTNTLGLLTTDCSGEAAPSGPPPFDLCSDGNAVHAFGTFFPGLYRLPLLYDPANSPSGDYTITVICDATICIGLEEQGTEGWSVHPNPGRDGFQLLRSTAGGTQVPVRLLDVVGRPVWTGMAGASPMWIDPGPIPPGAYVVQVLDGPRPVAFRWIRE
jgi:hypothetical protein